MENFEISEEELEDEQPIDQFEKLK